MQKVILIVIALVAIFAATEFVPVLMSNYAPLSGGPVHGVVIDASNNLPLPGATIIVQWVGHLSGSQGPSYPCYYVALAQSDEKGLFDVPEWKKARDDGPSWLRGMTTDDMERPIKVLAYKPGYVLNEGRVGFSVNEEVRLKMDRFVGSVQSRLSDLVAPFKRQAMCEGNAKALIPVYQAMFDEAKASAKTPAELELTEILLITLETAQFDNNEALRRAGARDNERVKGMKKL